MVTQAELILWQLNEFSKQAELRPQSSIRAYVAGYQVRMAQRIRSHDAKDVITHSVMPDNLAEASGQSCLCSIPGAGRDARDHAAMVID